MGHPRGRPGTAPPRLQGRGFLVLGRRSGASAWRLFWAGGTLPKPVEDIGLSRRPAPAWTGRWAAEMFRGASLTWPLVGSALVGVWVVTAPWVFGTTGPAFTVETVLGALAVVVAFVAWAEVTRAARLLNLAIGLAVAVAPWVLPGASLAARLGDLVAGALLVALSLPRGPIRDRYGSWDPVVV